MGQLSSYLSLDQTVKLETAVYQLAHENRNQTKRSVRLVITMLEKIRVVETDRLLNTAGYAFFGRSELHLHSLLRVAGREADHEHTLWHEIGHFLAYWLLGDNGHGKRWRSVMATLGYPNDKRCHNYDYLCERTKLWTGTCSHCGTKTTQHGSRGDRLQSYSIKFCDRLSVVQQVACPGKLRNITTQVVPLREAAVIHHVARSESTRQFLKAAASAGRAR